MRIIIDAIQKRHFQKDLAIRRSPENRYCSLPNILTTNYPASIPAPPTITPADSDCDEAPKVTYTDTSVWSADSSFVGTPMEATVSSPYPDYSQPMHSAASQNSVAYSDDYEMGDNMLLSPGLFQADPSRTLSDRIPTPMNAHFGHSTQMPSSNHVMHGMEMGGFGDSHNRGRRLPSPISEDEPSPSTVLEGLSEIHMEVEKDTPMQEVKELPRKGHRRSPYGFNNLANWSMNNEMSSGGEQKRTFSMGYRSDCEKCRDRVPGHFSHIITS